MNNLSRRQSISRKLAGIIDAATGVEVDEDQWVEPFVALDLDSLSLTQIAIQVRRDFSVEVTFRQLMETHDSVDKLAAMLASQLPDTAEELPTELEVEPSVSQSDASQSDAGAPVNPSLIEQVIYQQLKMMEQQMALLSGRQDVQPQQLPNVTAKPVSEAASSLPVDQLATPGKESNPASSNGASVSRSPVKSFGAIARIDASSPNKLTALQQSRLDLFVRFYTERTKGSKSYTETHRPHLADPRVVTGFKPLKKELTYQVVVDRSSGSHIWDVDNNEYVDALNGFGMSLFGWQPKFILDAVKRQLDEGYEIGPQHPLAGEVARLVCELTGCERAGLCNTGSEAVMGALRIARTVTGRQTIVVFSGAYHGIFDEVIVRGGKQQRAFPAAPGIMPNTAQNVLVLEYGKTEDLAILRSRASEIAAVLVEPVQSRRPDLQPVEFLRELREITEESGSLLVFDEVVTGFRCHPGGIQSLFGIRADICTYGKVVGGGFPIGIIAGKREYLDALDGGSWQFGDDSIPTVGVTYFAGTFVRHPLALAAAQAALKHMADQGPKLQEQLTALTSDLVATLNAHCQQLGAPIAATCFSSVWRINFVEDHPLQDLLFAMMRSRGVHILENFPCFLTTAHSVEDVDWITTAFKDSVVELQEGGFLPKHRDSRKADFDSSNPPVANARLGRDPEGNAAWYVPDPKRSGSFLRFES